MSTEAERPGPLGALERSLGPAPASTFLDDEPGAEAVARRAPLRRAVDELGGEPGGGDLHRGARAQSGGSRRAVGQSTGPGAPRRWPVRFGGWSGRSPGASGGQGQGRWGYQLRRFLHCGRGRDTRFSPATASSPFWRGPASSSTGSYRQFGLRATAISIGPRPAARSTGKAPRRSCAVTSRWLASAVTCAGMTICPSSCAGALVASPGEVCPVASPHATPKTHRDPSSADEPEPPSSSEGMSQT